jgi:anti-sigma factor RsiW
MVSLHPTCRVVAIRLAGVDDVDELGRRLSDHVATCLRCQAEAARYRSLQRRLGALADQQHPAPEGFAASVMYRLSEPIEVPTPRRRRPLLPSRATVTAAATGAAVVATAGTLAVLLRRLHPPI